MTQLTLRTANVRTERMCVQLLTGEKCGSISLQHKIPISCKKSWRRSCLFYLSNASDSRPKVVVLKANVFVYLLWRGFLCKVGVFSKQLEGSSSSYLCPSAQTFFRQCSPAVQPMMLGNGRRQHVTLRWLRPCFRVMVKVHFACLYFDFRHFLLHLRWRFVIFFFFRLSPCFTRFSSKFVVKSVNLWRRWQNRRIIIAKLSCHFTFVFCAFHSVLRVLWEVAFKCLFV